MGGIGGSDALEWMQSWCNSASGSEYRVLGRVDCSPLKDRHLDAVTRCASGAEASLLLRKGDAGIDIVLVEVRSCLWR